MTICARRTLACPFLAMCLLLALCGLCVRAQASALAVERVVDGDTIVPGLIAPRNLAGAAPAPVSGDDIKVWVNTSSKVYHCPGSRHYGTTKRGTYMRQRDALSAGNRPAAGKQCS